MKELQVKKDYARLCPVCGASSLDFSTLIGGRASCRACNWSGTVEEALHIPVEHTYGTQEGTGLALSNDYRALYRNQQFVTGLIQFLVKWGFVPSQQVAGRIVADHKVALRYVAAIARAGLRAIVEEREKIEKEEKGGRATAAGPA